MGHKARKKSFKANKASRTPKRPIQAPAAEEGEDSSGDGKSKKDSTSNLSKIQREWLVLHRERLQLVKELAATKKLKPTSNPSHPDYDKLQVILKRLETNPQLLELIEEGAQDLATQSRELGELILETTIKLLAPMKEFNETVPDSDVDEDLVNVEIPELVYEDSE